MLKGIAVETVDSGILDDVELPHTPAPVSLDKNDTSAAGIRNHRIDR